MVSGLTLSGDMVLVLLVLGLTIGLFVSELIRIDIAALSILVLIGLLGLVPTDQLFNGFASNAVISLIAVMILGAGLDRTGVMNQVSVWILKWGRASSQRLVALVGASSGLVSSMIQNAGVTALFMPVVSRVSSRRHIPLPQLLMPMGFGAMVGGTITMVGSSPLILLNDLMLASNRSLPPGAEALQGFGLFAVAPVGLALLATSMGYFWLFGQKMLPKSDIKGSSRPANTEHYFADVYGIEGEVYEVLVTVDSPLVGMRISEAERLPGAPLLLGIQSTDQPRLAPPADEMVWVGTVLGVMGTREQVGRFALDHQLKLQPRLKTFAPTVWRVVYIEKARRPARWNARSL